MHHGYPLTPDKIKVMKQIFSKYQLQIVEKNEFCLGKNEKLIPNLAYKKILKLHYKKPKTLFKATIKTEKNMG